MWFFSIVIASHPGEKSTTSFDLAVVEYIVVYGFGGTQNDISSFEDSISFK